MIKTTTIGFCNTIQHHRLFMAFTFIAMFSAHLLGQPISITDFRIPTSSYQRLLGNLNGSWNQNATDMKYSNSSSINSDNTNMTAGLSYVRSAFSEDRSLEINANMNSNLWWNKYSNEYAPGMGRSDESSNSSAFDFSPFARYSTYFVPDAWFWFAEGEGEGHYQHNRGEYSELVHGMDTTEAHYVKNRSYDISAGVGVGFGKMRDGQSVFKTLRVLNKLEEDGALERSLSREEILLLVDRLSRQNEYAYSQDRYAKFLIRDIFIELEKMKILRDPGSYPYEVLRAAEVLSESIEPRLFGWRVALGIYHGLSGSDRESDPFLRSMVTNSQDYVRLNGDYGYPVSLNTQLSANIIASIPRKDPKRRVALTLGARAAYQIGERIDASIGYTLNRSSSPLATDDSENFERYLDHQVDMRFDFFIENDVSFNVTGGYSYHKNDAYVPDGNPSSVVNSSYIASFGLRYRFL